MTSFIHQWQVCTYNKFSMIFFYLIAMVAVMILQQQLAVQRMQTLKLRILCQRMDQRNFYFYQLLL